MRKSKMSKLLCLLLAVTMLLMVCAGCNSGNEAVTPSEEPTTATEPEKVDPVESVEPDAAEEEPSVVEAEPANSISYPLSGGTTLTYWLPYNASLVQNFLNSWEDNLVYSKINELTGVTLEYISPSSAAATEQFGLMIASGEYADIMDVVSNYTGGALTALEEDVIVDLTDLVEKNAPDYLQKLSTVNELTRKATVEDNGQILAVYGIANDCQPDSGLIIRKDWLDELGLAVPETIDELYYCMMAVKTEYNPQKLLDIISSINVEYVVGAFGIKGFGVTESANLGTYLNEDGKTVSSSVQSDGYREYIEWVAKCYANGLIDEDFYTYSGFGASPADVAGGDVFVFRTRSDGLPSIYSRVENDENFDLIAVPGIVKNKGDVYEFGDAPVYLTDKRVSISTCCEDPELALQYLNWFFTDDAFIITNYGEEGVSFEYDENNVPCYTELVTNNEFANLATIRMLYCFQYLPLYLAQDAVYRAATEKEHEVMEVWGQMGYSRTLPTLSYTDEETAVRSKHMTDLLSHTAEVVTQWVIGQAELNDETWATFQDELVTLGIDEVMEVEQTAYDRYMSK